MKDIGDTLSMFRVNGVLLLTVIDQGKVILNLEMPQLEKGLQSKEGLQWVSGVDIMSGLMKTTAIPRACLSHIQSLRKRVTNTNLLEKVGYKREYSCIL